MSYIVERKRPNLYRVAGLVFLPGSNVLSDSEYNNVKDNPHFKAQIKNEVMTVEKAQKSKGTPKKVEAEDDPHASVVNEILAMTATSAKKAVKDLLSIPVLKSLIENDSRKGVSSAAKKQLDILLTPDTPEGEADGSDSQSNNDLEGSTVRFG